MAKFTSNAKQLIEKHPAMVTLVVGVAGILVIIYIARRNSSNSSNNSISSCQDQYGNPVDCNTGQLLQGGTVGSSPATTGDLTAQIQDLEQVLSGFTNMLQQTNSTGTPTVNQPPSTPGPPTPTQDTTTATPATPNVIQNSVAAASPAQPSQSAPFIPAPIVQVAQPVVQAIQTAFKAVVQAAPKPAPFVAPRPATNSLGFAGNTGTVGRPTGTTIQGTVVRAPVNAVHRGAGPLPTSMLHVSYYGKAMGNLGGAWWDVLDNFHTTNGLYISDMPE